MKIALVTGATRGIGKAITIKLSELGYNVFGLYKNNVEIANELSKKYKKIFYHRIDVSKEDKVKKVLDLIVNKFGQIDVLVNNAGIDLFGEIEKYSSKNFNEMVDVNLKSIFYLSKYSIPHLKKSNNPVIINISSRMGFPEFTEEKFVVYGMVKAGVTSFAVGLSKELKKDKIRVNVVIPTPTKTDLFDEVFTPEEEKMLKNKGKLGRPEDVADLVIDLIEDRSANGKILVDKRVYL